MIRALTIPYLMSLMLPAQYQGHIEAGVDNPATITDSGTLIASSPRPEQITFDPATKTLMVNY